MSTITPNMNLIEPTVSQEPGPAWATEVNQSLTLIDQHDHSPGHGVQVTTAGLNINTSLPFNGNSATSLLADTFNSQLTALSTPYSLYVVNGDLWYTNGAPSIGAGTPVQLTSGTTIIGTPGSITGLTPPARVLYSAPTFFFYSNTLTPANISGGSLLLGNIVASSKTLTLSPPNAMAANYTITLPTLAAITSPPGGAPSFLTIDSSGNMGTISEASAFVGPTNIAPGGVSAANQIGNGVITTTQISSTAGILASQLAAGALSFHTVNIGPINTGSWVVPAGVTQVITTIVGGGGGGGGGGGSSGSPNAGGGGGGGGKRGDFITSTISVVGGDTFFFAVGVGGAGGAGGSGAGASGSVGGRTVLQKGTGGYWVALGGNPGTGGGTGGGGGNGGAGAVGLNLQSGGTAQAAGGIVNSSPGGNAPFPGYGGGGGAGGRIGSYGATAPGADFPATGGNYSDGGGPGGAGGPSSFTSIIAFGGAGGMASVGNAVTGGLGGPGGGGAGGGGGGAIAGLNTSLLGAAGGAGGDGFITFNYLGN